jgi:hypothetical protein
MLTKVSEETSIMLLVVAHISAQHHHVSEPMALHCSCLSHQLATHHILRMDETQNRRRLALTAT